MSYKISDEVIEIQKQCATVYQWSRANTACTVLQAVVKANSKSNGKGQISTPWGSETQKGFRWNLEYVVGMTTHANPYDDSTTWVVATWHIGSLYLSA